MSSDRLGVKAELILGAQELTDDGQSASNITINETLDSQPAVGPRGIGGDQPGNFMRRTLSIGAFPYTKQNDAQLARLAGNRLTMVYREAGVGSGKPQRTGQVVVATLTRTYNRQGGGGIVCSLTAPLDGPTVDTNQS